MVRIFNAVLAAILGSGGSAAPAQHSRIPVVTYGANALAQAGGATKESTATKATIEIKQGRKAAIKDAVKTKAEIKGSAIKDEKLNKKYDKEIKQNTIKGELKGTTTVK
jgi:protein involved in polysaccharide export with SLBB domain